MNTDPILTYQLSKKRNSQNSTDEQRGTAGALLVTPGDVITEDSEYMRGHGILLIRPSYDFTVYWKNVYFQALSENVLCHPAKHGTTCLDFRITITFQFSCICIVFKARAI